MELLSAPILPPGQCLLTGQAGPVVDTGKTIEWFPANAIRPRVYLSVDAIRELADVAGVRDVKSTAEVVHESAVYNRGYMDAIKERVGDQLVELVDRLGLLAALLGSSDGVPDADDEAAGAGAGEAGPAGAEPADEEPGVAGPGYRPRGQRRRADVPGNPAA